MEIGAWGTRSLTWTMTSSLCDFITSKLSQSLGEWTTNHIRTLSHCLEVEAKLLADQGTISSTLVLIRLPRLPFEFFHERILLVLGKLG